GAGGASFPRPPKGIDPHRGPPPPPGRPEPHPPPPPPPLQHRPAPRRHRLRHPRRRTHRPRRSHPRRPPSRTQRRSPRQSCVPPATTPRSFIVPVVGYFDPQLVHFPRHTSVAFDGCTSIKVPDTPRNCGWLGKMKAALGVTGYPAVELMTLVETGTRALLGATFGPPATGETDYARRLLSTLSSEMLLLADRGF